MKTLSIIWLCTLLLTFGLQAQGNLTLRGTVLEWNSAQKSGTGKPLTVGYVQITSPEGTKPTRSDQQGKFVMEFAGKNTGDLVAIKAEKSGLEVVNKNDLTYLPLVTGRSITVYMCPKGQIDLNRAAYYEVSIKGVTREFQKKIRALEKEGQEKEQLLAQLNKEFSRQVQTKEEAVQLLTRQFENLKVSAKALSDRFAQINLDEQSELYRQAFALFQEGKLDETNALLEKANVAEKAEKIYQQNTDLKHRIEQNDSALAQAVPTILLEARTKRLSFQFDKADSLYRQAVRFSNNDSQVMSEYGEFLYLEGRTYDAFKQFDQVLSQAKSPGDSLIGLYMQAIQFQVSGKPEKINDVLPALSRILSALETTDSCRYSRVGRTLYEVVAVMVEDGRTNMDKEASLLRLRDHLDDPGCEDVVDEELKDICEMLLLLQLMDHSSSGQRQQDYAKALNNKKYDAGPVGVFVKVYANYRLVQNFAASGNWLQVDEALTKLNTTFEKSDTFSKRMFRHIVIALYADIGQLMQANGIFAKAKEYLEVAAGKMAYLHDDDPLEWSMKVRLPDMYYGLSSLEFNNVPLDSAAVAYWAVKGRDCMEIFFNKKLVDSFSYFNGLYYYHNYMGGIGYSRGDKSLYQTQTLKALDMQEKWMEADPRSRMNTYLLSATGFLWNNFNIAAQTNDSTTVRLSLDLVRKLESTIRIHRQVSDTIRVSAWQTLKRLRFFYRSIGPETKRLMQLFQNFFQMENQLDRNNLALSNYDREKAIVALLDKGLFIEKTDSFLLLLKAQHLGSLSYTAMLNRRFEEAETYAREGLALHPEETWIATNLATSLLFQNRFAEAEKVCRQYSPSFADELGITPFFKALSGDLEAFQSIGLTHPDAQKLLQVFKK